MCELPGALADRFIIIVFLNMNMNDHELPIRPCHADFLIVAQSPFFNWRGGGLLSFHPIMIMIIIVIFICARAAPRPMDSTCVVMHV